MKAGAASKRLSNNEAGDKPSLQIAQHFKLLEDVLFCVRLFEVCEFFFEDLLDEFVERAAAGMLGNAQRSPAEIRIQLDGGFRQHMASSEQPLPDGRGSVCG